MLHKHTSLLSFLLVLGVHIGALAAVLMSTPSPHPVDVSMPVIEGVLVMAKPERVPEPIVKEAPPPPPEKKTEPKPKPLPKAPASERAVKAPEAVVEPVKTAAEPSASQQEPAPVVPPRADAGQLSNPTATYPTLSRRLREAGIVVLEILILADGTVGEIKLKTSSGYKRLDDSAKKAVAKWRYQPATHAGEPIDFWYEQPVEFTLHE
jgi:protein TonB